MVLPQISQIYTELLAEDVLPQIARIYTDAANFRGCTCLKCTNRARTDCLLVKFNNGLNGLNGFLLLGMFNNGFIGLNGFDGCVKLTTD